MRGREEAWSMVRGRILSGIYRRSVILGGYSELILRGIEGLEPSIRSKVSGRGMLGRSKSCDAVASGKGGGMLATYDLGPHTWKENGVVVHTARLEEKLDPGGQYVRHSPYHAPF